MKTKGHKIFINCWSIRIITSLTKLTYEGGRGAGSATAMNKLDHRQIYPREFRRRGIERGGGILQVIYLAPILRKFEVVHANPLGLDGEVKKSRVNVVVKQYTEGLFFQKTIRNVEVREKVEAVRCLYLMFTRVKSAMNWRWYYKVIFPLSRSQVYIMTTILEEPYLMRAKPKKGESLVGNDQYEGYCKVQTFLLSYYYYCKK
jgi:hypothetical protein